MDLEEEDPLIGQTFYFTAKPPKEDAPRGGNGSQVLPVAELGDDFDGVPEDGMEYLFLVRREAKSRAKVYRANLNPYQQPEEEENNNNKVITERRSHSSKPSEEWRRAFIEKFKQTRIRMVRAPKNGSLELIDQDSIPAPKQESAWRIFINGKRSKPVKQQQQPSTIPTSTPITTITTTTTTVKTKEIESTIEEDTDMTDDLESAKAAILASLELDTPDEPLPLPPPPPSSTSTSTPTTTTTPSSTTTEEQRIPEYVQLPQLPTPNLLLSIPPTSIIHVLSHFNEWFRERIEQYLELINWVPSTIFAPPSLTRSRKKPTNSKSTAAGGGGGGGGGGGIPKTSIPLPTSVTKEKEKEKVNRTPPPLPSPHEIHWILSLLTRLNDLLDGDDLSNLRLLSKTLVEMIELSEKDDSLTKTKGGKMSLEEKRKEQEEEGEEMRARCWMIVAAISTVWKQEDLWNSNL